MLSCDVLVFRFRQLAQRPTLAPQQLRLLTSVADIYRLFCVVAIFHLVVLICLAVLICLVTLVTLVVT